MADNKEFWIEELSRIYKRSTEAINTDEMDITEELSYDFNRLLDELTDEYPNNRIISSTSGIAGTRFYDLEEYHTKREILSMIRNRSERIAQSLNIELESTGIDAEDRDMDSDLSINIDNSNTVRQSMSSEIEISNQIDNGLWEQDIKDELQKNKAEYWAELDTDQPDESKLRRLLEKVSDYSTDIAAKMAAEALKKGVIAVLGLSL